MSELVSARRKQNIQNFRWDLLAGASVIALLSTAAAAPAALADDTSHFYFEVGSQYGLEAGGSSGWLLPFAAPGGGGEGGEGGTVSGDARAPTSVGSGGAVFPIRPQHSWDFSGAVKLQPAGSDLLFSLGVQVGRTAHRDESGALTQPTNYGTGHYSGNARERESHTIIDFQIGKDLGLGMFGQDGSSVVSVGVRYAHFTSLTVTNFHTSTKYFSGGGNTHIERSFVGAGPMISWQASMPLMEGDNGGFSIDWGADGAVLFGRQTVNLSVGYDTGQGYSTGRHGAITIPAVGGFAGLSWRPADSGLKVSFGYKADAYFHVLDGGIDTGQRIDRITHGPFLNVGFQAN